jgi:hypothetical protein
MPIFKKIGINNTYGFYFIDLASEVYDPEFKQSIMQMCTVLYVFHVVVLVLIRDSFSFSSPKYNEIFYDYHIKSELEIGLIAGH